MSGTRGSSSYKALVLGATETRLALRNKTVAVSSIVIPLGLGIFWAVTFDGGSPAGAAVVVALQLAVALGMGLYVTATQTVVARRHARVLTRMRTSGISDGGLLAAVVAPSAVLGVAQLAVFAVINAVAGTPAPVDPTALALALLGGTALTVTAALATTVVTPSPERAQITTLPLVFVLLGAAIALVVVPEDGWWQALLLLPGAAIGQLTEFAFVGGAWTAGAGGVPVGLPAVAALLVWPLVFGVVAARRFRWDPRS